MHINIKHLRLIYKHYYLFCGSKTKCFKIARRINRFQSVYFIIHVSTIRHCIIQCTFALILSFENVFNALLQGTYSLYSFCYARKVVCVCIMERDFKKRHTHCEKGELVQTPPSPLHQKHICNNTLCINLWDYLLTCFLQD